MSKIALNFLGQLFFMISKPTTLKVNFLCELRDKSVLE